MSAWIYVTDDYIPYMKFEYRIEKSGFDAGSTLGYNKNIKRFSLLLSLYDLLNCLS